MAGAVLVLRGRSLGDTRRLARLRALVAALGSALEHSMPQALAGHAALKAAYRFFANRAVTPERILATARQDLLERCAATEMVLLVQDTTTISIPRAATAGLGPVGTRAQPGQGFLLHTVLAADSSGLPLGVLLQHGWVREETPATAHRRQRPPAEKESDRWRAGEAAALALLPPEQPVLTVADREGDIFAWLAAPRRAGASLLVRVAQQQRCVDEDGGHLAAHVAAQPVAGRYRVAVPAAPGRAARTAVCTVRHAAVTLRPPQNPPSGTSCPEGVACWAVLAVEEQPPADAVPLHWLLLTTRPVVSFPDACQALFWYTQRWLIERYHAVLKVGCGVEQLQLRTVERLHNAVAVCALAAVQVLWLTDLARAQPDLPCTVAFSTVEWQTLVCLSTNTPTPPATPPTLHEATGMTARLGGFLGRKGDGEPGPKTIWRGLNRLKDFVRARALFDQPPPAPPVTGCG